MKNQNCDCRMKINYQGIPLVVEGCLRMEPNNRPDIPHSASREIFYPLQVLLDIKDSEPVDFLLMKSPHASEIFLLCNEVVHRTNWGETLDFRLEKGEDPHPTVTV